MSLHGCFACASVRLWQLHACHSAHAFCYALSRALQCFSQKHLQIPEVNFHCWFLRKAQSPDQKSPGNMKGILFCCVALGSISGDNFDISVIPHALLRPLQSTLPSGPWLFPAAEIWGDKVRVHAYVCVRVVANSFPQGLEELRERL